MKVRIEFTLDVDPETIKRYFGETSNRKAAERLRHWAERNTEVAIWDMEPVEDHQVMPTI